MSGNTVTLGKYQVVVNRLMTIEEVKAKCAEMNLDKDVTKFIVKEFNRAINIEDASWNRNGEYTVEDVTGDEGRVALGHSHCDVEDELRELLTPDELEQLDDATEARVQEVFDAFFQE